MVSTGVWDQLQRLYDNGGLEMVNVVATPPTQGIVLPTMHVRIDPTAI